MEARRRPIGTAWPPTERVQMTTRSRATTSSPEVDTSLVHIDSVKGGQVTEGGPLRDFTLGWGTPGRVPANRPNCLSARSLLRVRRLPTKCRLTKQSKNQSASRKSRLPPSFPAVRRSVDVAWPLCLHVAPARPKPGLHTGRRPHAYHAGLTVSIFITQVRKDETIPYLISRVPRRLRLFAPATWGGGRAVP